MARKKSSNRPNLPKDTLDRAAQEASGSKPVIKTSASQKQSRQKKGKVNAVNTQSTKTTIEDLAHEYAYVVNDLRNMGVLAAALFAGLVILSFIL